MPTLHGKVAIVTGANSGLGLETASALAAAGAQVVMACRHPARAAAALQQVRDRAPRASVQTMALDLSDLASVRSFAAACGKAFPKIDLLCNNAGVMAPPYQQTRDGFEMQMGVNHLGHFALTGLLLDQLRAAPTARVVNVASLAHTATRGLRPDDLHWQQQPYSRSEAYARSKLANLLFTFELSRRLQSAHLNILSVAAHPGYSATALVDGATADSFIKRRLGRIGDALIAQPAERGVLPTLYVASMPDVKSGDYFGPDGFMQFRGYPKRVGCRPSARDEAVAARLWTVSEQQTGVRYLSA